MSKTIKIKPIYGLLTEDYNIGKTKASSWTKDECCIAFQNVLQEIIDNSITTNAIYLSESEIKARYYRISTIKEILNLFNSQDITIED